MAVAVKCPACHKSLRVEGSNVGGQAKCDQCGMTFTVAISVDGTAVPATGPELVRPSEVAAVREASTAGDPPTSGAATAKDAYSIVSRDCR